MRSRPMHTKSLCVVEMVSSDRQQVADRMPNSCNQDQAAHNSGRPTSYRACSQQPRWDSQNICVRCMRQQYITNFSEWSFAIW